MDIVITDDFDLKKIAESGQCFRWKEIDDETYRIVAFHKVLYVRKLSDTEFDFSCTKKEWDTIFKYYFDMDENYQAIRENIDRNDSFLLKSSESAKGIRILRQDPWEMVISFIISQRKNIPAIKSCLEKVCRVAGNKLGNYDGEEIYDIPTPSQILEAYYDDDQNNCDNNLYNCSLGYRLPYIIAACKWAENGGLERASSLDDDKLCEELMSVKGNGIKVASCIRLFGYHRMDAFPIDVWVKRAMENYPKDFDVKVWSPYAGLMQQYLFMGIRKDYYDT